MCLGVNLIQKGNDPTVASVYIRIAKLEDLRREELGFHIVTGHNATHPLHVLLEEKIRNSKTLRGKITE